jgi:hypothetical protein
MPVQIVRPRSIGVASGGARRAILLTGASGVVGRAVLGRPSSLDQLVALGAKPLPDQRDSLRNSVQYWAAQKGYAQPRTAQAA